MNSFKYKWNLGPISAKQCTVGKSNKYHLSTLDMSLDCKPMTDYWEKQFKSQVVFYLLRKHLIIKTLG